MRRLCFLSALLFLAPSRAPAAGSAKLPAAPDQLEALGDAVGKDHVEDYLDSDLSVTQDGLDLIAAHRKRNKTAVSVGRSARNGSAPELSGGFRPPEALDGQYFDQSAYGRGAPEPLNGGAPDATAYETPRPGLGQSLEAAVPRTITRDGTVPAPDLAGAESDGGAGQRFNGWLPAVMIPFAEAVEAGKATISAGWTHFNKAHDGRWYDEKFPHHLDLNSPALDLSYTTQPLDDWRVRASLKYLGHVALSAVAIPWDDRYDPATRQCVPAGQCAPRSHWYGSGDVWGASLSAVRDFGESWFGEAGVLAYRPTWRISVPDWRRTPDSRPQPVHGSHDPWTDYSPMLGFGYRHGDMTAELTVESVSARHDKAPAIYDHGTATLWLGSSF